MAKEGGQVKVAGAVGAVGVIVALALAPATSAHYALPGGKKCKPVTVDLDVEYTASDIKAKDMSCLNARRNIRRLIDNRGTTFNCRHRPREQGDSDGAFAHTDYKCDKAGKKFIFALSPPEL